MANTYSIERSRILIVDDNPAIHEDIKKILEIQEANQNEEMDKFEEMLFDSKPMPKSRPRMIYDIDDAYKGEEAVKMVEEAERKGRQYSLIFMDVRMPPGIDGIQAIEIIWKKHSFIEIVICTAFSDYSWDEILDKFGYTDQLLFMKKPFNVVALRQTALSLTSKWRIAKRNREYMKHLESEVERRTKELKRLVKHMKKMKEKAEEADQLKSAFLSNMSHEIRTPMNAILGFTTLLSKSGLSEEDKNKYITYIQNSGKNLLTLINDIIDIAKIEAKQLKLEYSTVDLNQLLDELREQTIQHVNRLEKKDLKVSLFKGKENIVIDTDPHRLRQVLSNLLNNAVKFTDEGAIEFGYECKQNNIQFFVKDTGIGIPEQEFKEIFKRFGQSNAITSGHHEGTGLGLAISKNIVELLHGEIWVKSVVGQGSCFYFLLPLKAFINNNKQEKEKTIQEPSLKKIQNKSILVVEDVEENYWLIRELLKEYGPIITWATDGEEAIDILTHQKKFDLVLLDIKMPGISGFETLEILKERNLKNTPVIAQTAYALSNEHEKCLQAGFDDYISKPIEKSKLAAIVSKWL